MNTTDPNPIPQESSSSQQQQQSNTSLQPPIEEHIHPDTGAPYVHHPTQYQQLQLHLTPSESTHISRIVCIAIDQSAYSEYAFEWALHNFFDKDNDLVVLLNVRPIPSVPGPFGTTYMDFTDYLSVIEDQNRKESHSLLHYYANILKRANFNVKAIALRGDPRDELVRKCKELSCDTLIMGSRGLGMVKRALLGSLSDYCIHHVDCPVVVVKHAKPESLPQYGKHYVERMTTTTTSTTEGGGAVAKEGGDVTMQSGATTATHSPKEKSRKEFEQLPLMGIDIAHISPAANQL